MAEKFDTGNVEAERVRGELELIQAQTHENHHEDLHIVHGGILKPDSVDQISSDFAEVGRDQAHNNRNITCGSIIEYLQHA